MSSHPSSIAPPRPAPSHRRVAAATLALLVAGFPFALATLAGAGAAPADAGLVPIVRFMGGTKLALALLVAGLAALRYAGPERRRRRVTGLLAGACMGLGAGLIWSGAGFGSGFAVFAVGLALAALLCMKELEASLRRRP